MRAFMLRASGMSWTDAANEVGVTRDTLRAWSRTEEWKAEADSFVNESRTQLRIIIAGGLEEAVGTALSIMRSGDDDEVRLKAAGLLIDMTTKLSLTSQPIAKPSEPLSDADATKAIKSAASLPDLPDEVER